MRSPRRALLDSCLGTPPLRIATIAQLLHGWVNDPDGIWGTPTTQQRSGAKFTALYRLESSNRVTSELRVWEYRLEVVDLTPTEKEVTGVIIDPWRRTVHLSAIRKGETLVNVRVVIGVTVPGEHSYAFSGLVWNPDGVRPSGMRAARLRCFVAKEYRMGRWEMWLLGSATHLELVMLLLANRLPKECLVAA